MPYFYQFMAHASLDFVDEKLSAKTSNTFFPNIDRFNEWSISAFVTPSYLRFIVLHDLKNDENIKSFSHDVYETYIKLLLNPFYAHNEPIKSDQFDRKVKMASKRHLGVWLSCTLITIFINKYIFIVKTEKVYFLFIFFMQILWQHKLCR